MSHASMAGYFLFFYNRYRKEEILKRKEEKLMSLLEVKNVKKIYTTRFGSNQVEALRDVNFTVERGEYVAIMGESGSGKTTLLNILAALDKPTEGKVYLKDRDLGKLKEKEIATFRRQNLGFVFQDFNLLDTFSLKDNIFLPLVLSGKKYSEMEKRLKPIAEKLGIEKLLEKYPYEVSGGQKQRLCIARALLASAKILIFDDSTSAVDTATEKKIRKELAKLGDVTKIIIAQRISSVIHTDRIVILDDGKIHNIGTHEQLLKEDAIYQEIYASQMKGGNSDGIENEEC